MQPATGFLQRDPDNGAPATERTEVRVVYDADRLLLSVICHDSEPDRVLANQMQRDRSFETDDRFMWTIDTFLDGRTGYFFEINPAGAMGDGLVDPGADAGFSNDFGVGINRSWDGIWMARVRRTPTGWTAEMEIPFRTVNFDPNGTAWGINFQRTVRRKNEDSLWNGHARNQGLARMTNAGRLEGMAGISQGLGLDVKPYAVGNVASAPGRGRPDALSTGDIGLDAFYNVTPALRANVSINTDFAETEVDQRRVNLTRFPLFFEEKRDFFLEGSGFFDFSREPDEAVVPFFSRRIGLDDRGIQQPIDVGRQAHWADRARSMSDSSKCARPTPICSRERTCPSSVCAGGRSSSRTWALCTHADRRDWPATSIGIRPDSISSWRRRSSGAIRMWS